MKKEWILLFIAFLLAGIVVLQIFILPFYIMRMDNQGKICSELPNINTAEDIWEKYQETESKIIRVSPGRIFVELSRDRCPSKGEIVIFYDSFSSRNQIKKFLGDTFHNIPYRMINI